MGRVTLQTIADAVGVSRTTVSNAFSRPNQLTEELRRRIMSVADELGYAGPDPAARALRRGSAGAVGLLFTETLAYGFADPYAVGFFRGLAEELERDEGLGLLLIPHSSAGAAERLVADAVVDAFCVFSLADRHPAIEVIKRRRLPLVLVDEPEIPGLPFVGIDNRGAGRLAAAHLAQLGHQRLGVLAVGLHYGEEGWADLARQQRAAFAGIRDRVAGYRDAWAKAGHDWEPVPVYEVARNSREHGRIGAGRLLDLHPRPTAILAITDQLALGVLDAATERGLECPRHVSVVGFADYEAAAAAGLTTVREPREEKGRVAGRLLREPPSDEAEAPHVLLPYELVVRHSTAPPP